MAICFTKWFNITICSKDLCDEKSDAGKNRVQIFGTFSLQIDPKIFKLISRFMSFHKSAICALATAE